jgi:hypothetical protein
MKFVTALSMAAFVLVPTVGFAQENGTGNREQEPGVVEKLVGKVTGRSPHNANKNDDANKSGDQDSKGKDYPDFPAIKKDQK